MNLSILNNKEIVAIELRYLGNTVKQISEKIETPESTINGWFDIGGKLYSHYKEYAEEMNKARIDTTLEEIKVTDKEWFVLTTNVVRHFGKMVQGREVPLVDKEGNAIAGPDGKPIMINIPPNFNVGDLERVWKIQRVMQNLPTNYEKSDVTQTNIEEDAIIRELGLTEEDFKDENIKSTTSRIIDYLERK
jgi:hypothetical protein